jgi:predicted esterase
VGRMRTESLGMLALGALFVTTLTTATGCERKSAQAQARPQSADSPARHEGAIKAVEVEGDRELLVVVGGADLRQPIVYLHGMCADPKEDLEAFGGLARERGTLIALTGDVPCGPDKPPGRTAWPTDPEAIDARIRAAVDAVNARGLGAPLNPDEPVVIGESMGAARAEALAARFPERYKRLVLVGSPQAPSPENLASATAIANVVGEKESQEKMKSGTRALEAKGKPVRFFELPGATHGKYGPEGERIMNEAVGFAMTGRAPGGT